MRCTFGARLGERLAYPFASAVVHGLALLALTPHSPIRVEDESSAATVVIETIEPAPPPLEPRPPEPAPPPDDPPLLPAAPPAIESHEPRELDVQPPEIDAPTDAVDPGPMDLTATVLTASGGSGAAMKVSGNTGAARMMKNARASAPRAGSTTGDSTSRTSPRVVALEDLSRAPSPPALDAALARLYPPDARRDGRAGSAAVRALIGADGRVRSASIRAASDPAFGQACQTLVLGSAWSPPLDAAGEPVATWVHYTCRFQIDR